MRRMARWTPAVILPVLLMVQTMGLFWLPSVLMNELIALVGKILFFLAALRLTSPPEQHGLPPAEQRLGALLRIGALVLLICSGLLLMVDWMPRQYLTDRLSQLATILSFGVIGVVPLATVVMRRLALRLGERDVADHLKIVSWLMPISMAFACLGTFVRLADVMLPVAGYVLHDVGGWVLLMVTAWFAVVLGRFQQMLIGRAKGAMAEK